MSTTKIGVGPIARARIGSVELPPDVTLACPRCRELVTDKGQCVAEFRPTDYQPTGVARLALVVDCRGCGCSDQAPLIIPSLT
jgi:hypothetical protein